MSGTKTVDLSKVQFTSTVFPTDADMTWWESLTPEQRKAVEVRDEEEGYHGGIAQQRSMQELIAEAKAEKNGG